MMKRRLFAFGLAGVMLMGMSMNVFAKDAENDKTSISEEDTIDKTGSTAITYTVSEKFLVEIPASVNQTNLTTTALTIQGSSDLNPGNKLVVSVDNSTVEMRRLAKNGTDYDDTANTDAAKKYSLTISGLKNNTEVGSLSSYAETLTQIGELKVTAPDSLSVRAGNYKGTMTFTVAVTSE